MRINISLKKAFFEKLKLKASKKGMGTSEYIRYALLKLWEQED